MDGCSTISLLREREFNHYHGSKLGTERLGYSWDIVKGLHQLPSKCCHEGCVNSVTFSRNGRLMVSGSDDSTVKLWDIHVNAYSADDSLLLATVKTHHTQNIFCAMTCPHDNSCVVSCAADGTLRLNDLNSSGLSFDGAEEGSPFSSPHRMSSRSTGPEASAARLAESSETVLLRTRGIM